MPKELRISIEFPEELQGVKVPEDVLIDWFWTQERRHEAMLDELCRAEIATWFVPKSEPTFLDKMADARWHRICRKWNIKHKEKK